MAAEPESEAYFKSPDVDRLLRALQEATRATPTGDRVVFVLPPNAEVASARYHHFLYGQRGSGKSTLLRKLQREEAKAGRASVWVDQEIFSNLAFPDVLVSSVETVMSSVEQAVRAKVYAPADSLGWLRRKRFKPSQEDVDLLEGLTATVNNLRTLKFAPLTSQVEWTHNQDARSSAEVAGTVKVHAAGLQAKLASEENSAVQRIETITSSKGEFLERALPDFRSLLSRASALVDGGLIFLDDVYLLNRADQPMVLGYMHRLVKDTGLWLKIGSIRYLTTTYRSGSPPVGMQDTHDAHLIALDNGMRNLNSSRDFLQSILRGLAEKADVALDRVFNEGSLNRLALACGCVPRDYLTLAGSAIQEARNRAPSNKVGMDRVTVEDVNRAAGVLAPAKLDDMEHDAPERAASSRALIDELTEFCRVTKCAYFLVNSADRDLVDALESLRHLRFVHLLERSETVPERPSRYDVWLLDVSQLSAQRATQMMDFEGWLQREKRRRRSLIFSRPGPAEATPTPPTPRATRVAPVSTDGTLDLGL